MGRVIAPTTIACLGPTTISRQPSGRTRWGPIERADSSAARYQKRSTKGARTAGGGNSLTSPPGRRSSYQGIPFPEAPIDLPEPNIRPPSRAIIRTAEHSFEPAVQSSHNPARSIRTQGRSSFPVLRYPAGRRRARAARVEIHRARWPRALVEVPEAGLSNWCSVTSK